jgi:DNA-3-methyladenine glycosylase
VNPSVRSHEPRPLGREFFAGDATDVAPVLLNKVVATTIGGVTVSARIVEVEAYAGAADPASHAFRGPTPRNATMFGPPGRLYVYFTYGMHWCANVVCGTHGEAQAVLLRGAAPLGGLEVLRARRPKARRDRDLLRGPARLCQGLGIDRTYDGADLIDRRGVVVIIDDATPPPAAPVRTARIGVTAAADRPWRYFVEGDPNVSGTSSQNVPVGSPP